MTITTHSVVSFVIITNIERLRLWRGWGYNKKFLLMLVCIIPLLSHFALDAIPHFDYSIYDADMWMNIRKLTADCLVTLAIFVVIFWNNFKNLVKAFRPAPNEQDEVSKQNESDDLPFLFLLIAGAFFSLLPDIIIAFLAYLSINMGAINRFEFFHAFMHSSKKPDMLEGFFIQAPLLSFLIWILRISFKRMGLERTAEEAQRWLNAVYKFDKM